VTKRYSEVQRVTRETMRPLVVWVIALGVATALSVAVVAQAGNAGAAAGAPSSATSVVQVEPPRMPGRPY
jgi:hypothetical protein